MFDEYFSPPTSVASLVPTVVALVPADSTSSPSSTLVDQDAPLPSTSQTLQETKPPVLSSSNLLHGLLYQPMCTQSINHKEQVENRVVELYFLGIEYQLADHLANENVPASDPTSSDEQILPSGGRKVVSIRSDRSTASHGGSYFTINRMIKRSHKFKERCSKIKYFPYKDSS
ncbi:hypothetical protein Tco_0849172 [Tanacetum coccineum]